MINLNMEKLVNYCKQYGFIFQGSEIYGGLANTWDYGPLGSRLKNNIKDSWRKRFIQERSNAYEVDAAILMHPRVWEASGHVGSFSDPLIDCKSCKTRHRADHLIEDQTNVNPSGWSNEDMLNFIKEKNIKCPNCGSQDFTDIRAFNLMFKTFQGVTEDSKSELYLRPETAQGIFVNYANVQRTTRKKIPFGIGQIGKSFRNEITPGNFTFRMREFEQMELEFFCKPGSDLEWFEYWKNKCKNFLLSLGIKETSIKLRDHSQEELSHYSNATTDIEFAFPFGWGELWGIADRTDFDLKQHQTHSTKSLEYFDSQTNEKYIPYCIEPSLGADRVTLAFLCEAYDEEIIDEAKGDSRVVLRLSPALAPFKACVLPLSKKLSENASKVYEDLSKYFMVDYDETGSIGKRYRRQDEIGTPFCITYDFDSEEDNCVTIRHRDSMKQEESRIPINKLKEFIEERISF